MHSAKVKDFVNTGEIEIKTGPFGTQLKAHEYTREGTPVLNVRNLGYSDIRTDKLEYVGANTTERLSIHLLREGDIVFGRKGAVDRHSFITAREDGWMQGSDCIRLRIHGNRINPRYLSYYFLTKMHQAYMLSACSHGTTMASLNQSILEQIVFPLPPRELQDKIVLILLSLDEKRKYNQQINENLYQQLFALYDYYYDSADGAEAELGALCQFQEGYVNPAQTCPEYFDGDVKWLRAVDINESFIIETSRTLTQTGFQSAKKSAYLFSPNTIAISKSGTIGRLGIVADYMCGNRAVINIAPKDPLLLPYIYSFLKSHQKEFPDLAVGSVQKNLYVSLLEPLPVKILDPNALSEFCNVGNAILNTVSNNCQENIWLAQLRDTLLPQLMSGELDVSDIDL